MATGPLEASDPFHALRRLKNDAAHRQQVIILSAIEEMVRERKPGASSDTLPTPNEYFAAIMTGLEAEDQSHTPELVRLLEVVLSSSRVDHGVLRSKFTPVSNILVKLLKTNLDSELTAFMRDLVLCLGKLLLAQEPSNNAWNSPALMKVFFVLLTCFREKRPKVRKAAWSCTVDLLKLHYAKKTTVLANQVADFSKGVLSSCTANDVVPSLHLLGFLQEGLAFLPEARVRKLTEQILKLLSLDNNMLVQASLQTLKALVKSEEAPLSLPFLAEMTAAVLDLQPSRQDKDVAVGVLFCQLVAAAVQRLSALDMDKARAVLPRAVLVLASSCEGDSAQTHEAACWAMRQVIGCCADAPMEDPQTLPQALKDAFTATQKLLEYRYQSSWPVTLPFLGSLFVHFKEDGAPVLKSLLKRLGDLHDAVLTVTPPVAKAILGPISLAIEGMGIEHVLDILPLQGEDGTASRRLWLLPLLAQHGRRRPCHLHYFQTTILEMARKSNVVTMDHKALAKQQAAHRQRVLQLWSLLPAFCTSPADVSTAFAGLAPILANALQDTRYPELLSTVCQGLQCLIKSVVESEEAKDVEALGSLSKKFLPTLLALLDACPPEDPASAPKIKALSDTISSYASVTPPAFLSSLFKKLVQRLLEATQAGEKGCVSEEQKAKALVLCELALALVPSLDHSATLLLYKVIRPLVRIDSDASLQKRAYRVLACLVEHRGEALLTDEILEDLLPVLTDSLVTCHVAARQMRLRVLSLITTQLGAGWSESAERSASLATLVGEVLLCLKDSNAKAREAAYQLLLAMATVRAEAGEQDLASFTNMILAALAAHTPHMRSAAVLALSRLVFEFAPELEVFRVAVPDLLSTVMLLTEDPAREVVGSVVSFVRVCVAACPDHELRPRLPDVVSCLFSSNSKVRFRAKIKIILKKLCRKFGYDTVLKLAPETDRKLISHIQKQAARGERIAARDGQQANKTRNPQFDDLMGWGDEAGGGEESEEEEGMDFDDDDDDDDDDEEEDEDGNIARRLPGAKTVEASKLLKPLARKRRLEGARVHVRDGGEGVVDLLDESMIRNLRVGKARGRRQAEEDSSEEEGEEEEEVQYTAQGKIVVKDDMVDAQAEARAKKKRRAVEMMHVSDEDEEFDDGEGEAAAAKGQKRAKRGEGSAARGADAQGRGRKGGNKGPGEAYKNKKGGGDVKRKGQLEPYAYIPLNPKARGKEAANALSAVVGTGRKGRRALKQQRASKGGRR